MSSIGGSPKKPVRSLGLHVVKWCCKNLRQPDGPDAGGPWVFTDEQVAFIISWFSVDSRGRWINDRGVLRRMKGWGKSPFVATLALAELCGPVRFDGWAKDGSPLARPVAAAWVQIAGVSEKQTTNTMSMVLAMVAESPVVEEYGLDIGLTRIFTAAGGRLEPITASAATAEGARPTFVVQDETHLWTESNNGTDLDRVNRRNLAKSRDGSARMLETTNAHAAGQQSVAEKSYEVWMKGAGRVFYDVREAPAETVLFPRPGEVAEAESRMDGLRVARGDSVWLDLERISNEIDDGSTPPEDARRFYFNQIAAAIDSWLSVPEWAACADASIVVPDGTLITLGFDGSQHRTRGVTDATALIGCTLDGHIFEIAVWEQPPGVEDWWVPIPEVEAAVAMAFQRWTVVGFFADPAADWAGIIAGWEAKYTNRLKVKSARDRPIGWRMNRPLIVVQALEQFHSAVLHEQMTHDGSFTLTRHVGNARRRATTHGIQIAKEHPDSARKIDGAVAAVLAWQARLAAVAAGINDDAFVPRRVR